jgi:hypothetical protein
MVNAQRVSITVMVFWVVALLAYVSHAQSGPEPTHYVGDFRIAVEEGYSSTKDGVQFYSLQRIGSSEIDRAVLSIDASLPLAKYLHAAATRRVRITVEAVPATELQRLAR